jgi:PhoPQ-activated pathogenicity-related protein
LPTLSPSQITALDTYVAAPDSSYQYSLNSQIKGTGYTDYVINMISQTWTPQPGVSEVWQHWLQVVVPTTVTSKTAVINIENQEALNNSATPPTAADAYTVQTATTLGAITVFLPTVPNEPETFPSLGETTQLTEDPLVAFTFQQFLNGDGADWPILLPMVKSVVRTMDTTQSFIASESSGALTVNNFIITGQSKRGWTTWLTPAVDNRIIAIVPYVFDGLNLPDQVESQLDTYDDVTADTANGDSTAVEPYTTTFDQLDTPQGQSLLSIIDPLDYVNRPTYDIPKYMVDSTGDQFFVPDAQFFFSDLPGENYLRYVPNTDHSLDTDAYDGGINFEEAVIDGDSLPQFTWTVSNSGTEITLNTVTTPTSVTMWQATNTTNRDFRLETFGANWTSSTLTEQGNGTYIAQVTPPATGATDFFIQMQYTVNGIPLTFTTQISTVPLLTPTVTAIDPGGAFNGNPYAATGTATGLAGLSVSGTFSFTYYAGNSATGTPLPAAPTQAGTYTVVADFTTTDPDYSNGQSDPLNFAIGQATPTVVAQDDSGPFNGNPFAATAVATGIGGVTVNGTSSFTYYVGTSASGSGSTTAPTDAGTYTVVDAFASSDPNYGNTTSAPVTFTINPATPTVLAIDNGGTYSGSPFGATAEAVGVTGASVNGNPEFTYYPGTVTAGPLYSQIIAFGDSLSDTGNDSILSNETSPPPPYYDGRFSNGPNWIDQFASLLGVADPQPSLSGGTDYAYGGATAGSTYQGVPDLGEQVQTYLQNSPQADSKALFTVLAGANDFFYGQTNPLLVANSVDAALTSLINAGAEHILVSNLPPQGATPLFLAEGPAVSAAIDALDVELSSSTPTWRPAYKPCGQPIRE